MTTESPDAFVSKYRQTKGTPEEKYQRYLDKLKSSPKSRAKTIQGALDLLESSKDREVAMVAKALKAKRYLVMMTGLGENHGQLLETGEWNTKSQRLHDGVILVDDRYIGNYIGTAGVLAHELRHILDMESSRGKWLKHHVGTDNLDKAGPQGRANAYAGLILSKLGYVPVKKDEWEKIREITATIGQNWGSWAKDDDALIEANHKYGVFNSIRKGLKAQRCGRPCKTKQGPCGRLITVPPCWDHF